MPVGRLSVTATPVKPLAFVDGLVIVMVSVDVPPGPMLVGLKAFAIVGGATTVSTALAVPPVPSFVELTAPVVLVLAPAVEPVTLTEIEQLLPGVVIEPVLKLIGEVPELKVPPQVFAGLPAKVMPAGMVSLTAMPFIMPLLVAGFVIVIVRVDVPPTGTEVGVKDFVMVGGAVTVKVAEAVPPVPAFPALTFPVVLA
jgi:hypothetical protein